MSEPLSQLQFPGMSHIVPAAAHEQTEHQFMSRPGIYVHGRMMASDEPQKPSVIEHLSDDGSPVHNWSSFHAGTVKAAHDRLHDLGVPFEGTAPRFTYGSVQPEAMHNKPNPHPNERLPNTPVPYSTHARIPDSGDMWDSGDQNHYYMNEHEDKGSTSVILGPGSQGDRPHNYQTHRQAVSQAIRSGQHVPAHVRGPYEASGGETGPESYHDPSFTVNHKAQQKPLFYKHKDDDGQQVFYGGEFFQN